MLQKGNEKGGGSRLFDLCLAFLMFGARRFVWRGLFGCVLFFAARCLAFFACTVRSAPSKSLVRFASGARGYLRCAPPCQRLARLVAGKALTGR